MDLDDVAAARTGVQQVDVLGHHCLDETTLLELRQDDVRSVRSRVAQYLKSFAVEAPDPFGIASERTEGGDLERIDLCPDPGRGPKVRNSRLRRDAGASQ